MPGMVYADNVLIEDIEGRERAAAKGNYSL
jgi:hypothetical protein